MCLGVSVLMEFGHVGKHHQNNKSFDIANIDEVEQCQRDSMLIASIEQMLQELPTVAKECNIYRIPRRLLNRNPTAYTPQIISIGPFHRGRQDLMAMEQLKLRCLDSYLRRTNLRIETVVGMARSWEKSARNCYAEPIHMNSDEFVKMMLVDGCFMVEVMTIFCRIFSKTQSGLDPLFFSATDLCCDLIMLENQLPFFVLQGLFDQFSLVGLSFVQVTHRFCNIGFIKLRELPHNVSTQKIDHLVDFLGFYYTPSIVPAARESSWQENKSMRPPTATELWEAGVIFKKATQDKHIMDISFKGRDLEIPPFDIDDIFETYVRNLMALEQYHNDRKYAIQYFLFMNSLINTEKDVSLLVKAGIITNCIGGSNKEVSELFINLCKDVVVRGDCYYFNHISKALHEHCRARWNKWMASLRRNYFNTPWASVSFVAAAFLILFTFLQTLFSTLSLSK